MKPLSLYEQVGIVIPGSVMLFGILFYVPEMRGLLAANGITVGGLGIFLIIAYAVGHLVAAVGNLVETPYWSIFGGLPSLWVFGPHAGLLPQWQLVQLEQRMSERLGFSSKLAETDAMTGQAIIRQIYSQVGRFGDHERVDIFNGNYGLNRGLATSFVMLAVLTGLFSWADWRISLSLIVLSGLFLYRMHRFGVHYARELFGQFILLPRQSEVVQS